jgi:hypothetical protein
VLLAAAFSSFFSYNHLKHRWTCLYATKYVLVKGETLNADAQAYFGENGSKYSCDKLLAEYGAKSEELWNREELVRRHTILALLFSLVWLLSATTLISTIQALRNARGT